VLLRLAYLGVTNVFALLRLLPRGDRDKDIEILSLCVPTLSSPRE
jgi:putative transposase